MDVEPGRPDEQSGEPQVSSRTEELAHVLLRFYIDMRRGMDEFLQAYGLTSAEAEAPEQDPHAVFQALSSDGWRDALHDLEAGIRELKVHHAALLEGYHEATHEGSRRILETLDPEQIREEIEGSKVRVGWISVSARWRPLLVQAIWEEMLRRFQKYRSLDTADFDRFYRDGFRGGYRRFRDSRLPQAALPKGTAD